MEISCSSILVPVVTTTNENSSVLAATRALNGISVRPVSELSAATSSAIPAPISGILNVLLIPVMFSNFLNTTSIESSLSLKITSLSFYYSEVSYGQVTLNTTIFPSWITLPQTREYYGADSGSEIDVNWFSFVTDSLNAVNSSVDFRNYGYVLLVHAGRDEAASGDPLDLWSQASVGTQPFVYDGGVNLGFAILSETDPYGVFAHEFGHNLGLPDLYDYGGSQTFVRDWSVMDYGSWLMPPPSFMSPEKTWLGWISSDNITGVNKGQALNLTIAKLETPDDILAAKIPVGSRYYSIEYRRQVLTDSALPMEGVIVSYVDESLNSGQGIIKVKSADPSQPNLYDAAFTQGETFIDYANEVAVKVLSLTPDNASIRVQNGFADLVAESIQSIGNLLQGQNVTFDVYVNNTGVTPSDPCQVSLSINGTEFQTKKLPAVENGSGTVIEFGPWEAQAGTNHIRVNVDVNNDVIENNKANNLLSTTANVTEHYVSIDQAIVSKVRADVNSSQEVSFHARWNDNLSDIVSGTVFVNGTAYLTNSTGWITLDVTSAEAGNVTWTVTDVNVQGFVAFKQDTSSPSIVWDYLQVYESGVSKERCDVNSTQTVWAKARFASDDSVFDNSIGLLWIDGEPAAWNPQNDTWTISVSQNTIGQSNYSVPTAFQDNLFDLSIMTGQTKLSIIWDEINLTIVTRNRRINVGTAAPIETSGVFAFDSTVWNGTVVFNGSLVNNSVGRYRYTITSVLDPQYGLTVFNANTVDVIFDQIVLNISATATRIDVGKEAKVLVTGFYQYDGKEWSGEFTLNDSLIKSQVGRYSFLVTSVTDPSYNLTAFQVNPISIIWDRVDLTLTSTEDRVKVGLAAPLTIAGHYDFDGMTFQGNVTFNDNLSKNVIGRVNYTVIGITDLLYNLTVFRSNLIGVVFDDLVCNLTVDSPSIGKAKITVNVTYAYDGKPVTDGNVTLGGAQMTNLGNGSYAVELSDWKPYATYGISVQELSFSKNLETTALLTSNTVFFSFVALIIVFMAVMLVVYVRTHRFHS